MNGFACSVNLRCIAFSQRIMFAREGMNDADVFPLVSRFFMHAFFMSFQNSLPAISLKSATLLDRLKAAYKAFTMGGFAESRQEFDFILRAVPLVVGETRAEGNELKEVKTSQVTHERLNTFRCLSDYRKLWSGLWLLS